MKLSVLIPAQDEEGSVGGTVEGVVAALEREGIDYEVVVINDGSKDATARVTEEFAKAHRMVQLISLNPNRGKGGAVRAGMLAAQGRYALFTDADQSTPIQESEKLLAKLEAGYDMAIGSRAVTGAQVEQAQVWYRALAGKLFGVGTRVLCIRGIADTQCGFKAMKREVAQKVFPHVTSNTAIFDIEMLVVATRTGYRIAEVPVHWVHDPDTRIPYTLVRALKIWVELFRINRAQRVVWPMKVWK